MSVDLDTSRFVNDVRVGERVFMLGVWLDSNLDFSGMMMFETDTTLAEKLFAEFLRYRIRISAYLDDLDDLDVELPRTGSLELDDVTWDFFRHGSGAQFQTQEAPRVAIDIKDFDVSGKHFTDWELSCFLGSRGRASSKAMFRLTGRNGLSAIESSEVLISHLEALGTVVADGRHFVAQIH